MADAALTRRMTSNGQSPETRSGAEIIRVVVLGDFLLISDVDYGISAYADYCMCLGFGISLAALISASVSSINANASGSRRKRYLKHSATSTL